LISAVKFAGIYPEKIIDAIEIQSFLTLKINHSSYSTTENKFDFFQIISQYYLTCFILILKYELKS